MKAHIQLFSDNERIKQQEVRSCSISLIDFISRINILSHAAFHQTDLNASKYKTLIGILVFDDDDPEEVSLVC